MGEEAEAEAEVEADGEIFLVSIATQSGDEEGRSSVLSWREILPN